jgi:hypothetical protein
MRKKLFPRHADVPLYRRHPDDSTRLSHHRRSIGGGVCEASANSTEGSVTLVDGETYYPHKRWMLSSNFSRQDARAQAALPRGTGSIPTRSRPVRPVYPVQHRPASPCSGMARRLVLKACLDGSDRSGHFAGIRRGYNVIYLRRSGCVALREMRNRKNDRDRRGGLLALKRQPVWSQMKSRSS